MEKNSFDYDPVAISKIGYIDSGITINLYAHGTLSIQIIAIRASIHIEPLRCTLPVVVVYNSHDTNFHSFKAVSLIQFNLLI